MHNRRNDFDFFRLFSFFESLFPLLNKLCLLSIELLLPWTAQFDYDSYPYNDTWSSA